MKYKTHNTRKEKFSTSVAPCSMFRASCEGFTLIELVVATGVFVVVMLISVGALISVIGANRHAQATTSVLNNVNFAVDSMAREIRVGTGYLCQGSGGETCSIADNNTTIRFVSSNDVLMEYKYNSNNKNITRRIGASILPITASDISIDDVRFAIEGTATGDTSQPRVIIIVRGTAQTSAGDTVDFDLQTSVTQRIFDIQ